MRHLPSTIAKFTVPLLVLVVLVFLSHIEEANAWSLSSSRTSRRSSKNSFAIISSQSALLRRPKLWSSIGSTQEEIIETAADSTGSSSPADAAVATTATSNGAFQQQLQSATSVIGGVLLTYLCNNIWELGPIFSSSMIGLLAAMTLPSSCALAAFCGSFVGMATPAVIPATWRMTMGASAMAALVVNHMDRHKILVGVGGRLGWMAQCAGTLQFLLWTLIVPRLWKTSTMSSMFTGRLWDVTRLAVPSTKVVPGLLWTCLWTMVGALCMSALQEFMTDATAKSATEPTTSLAPTEAPSTGQRLQRFLAPRLATSVAASSVTGLVGVLLDETLLCGTASGLLSAGPLFCGSFVAMSAAHVLPTYGDLVSASLVTGVIQSALMPFVWLGGWSGKLGSAALLGVLAYQRGVRKMVASLKQKQ